MINIYRYDTKNVGDFLSAPYIYFKEYQSSPVVDIMDADACSQIKDQKIILGGGGLLSPTFINNIIRLANNNEIYSWGIGENWYINLEQRYYEGPKYYHPIISKFAKVGLRDFTTDYSHVPCASCMHRLFDIQPSNRYKVGFYNHFRLNIPTEIPTFNNYGPSIRDKIDFLSDHEIIITNSYHGAYWSMLLNKKLIVVPFGSKFYNMHDNILFASLGTIKKSLDYDFPNYSGYLEECRKKTLDYHEIIKDNVL